MVKHVHLRIHTWKQESLKVQPGDGVRSDHTVEHLGWLLHKDSFCVWDGGYMCVYSSMYRIFVYVWVCMFKSVHVLRPKYDQQYHFSEANYLVF